MKPARAAALVAALLIAVGAFEPFYLRVFRLDHRRFAAAMAALQYRKVPGLREFLLQVREHTSPGDRILLTTGYRAWDGGYEYCYARALYILAGREVLPLITPDDRMHPENLQKATSVAAFGNVQAPPGFTMVWRGTNGSIFRRAP